MSPQYGELRPTSSWDRFTSLGYLCKYQLVSRLGTVTAWHLVVDVSQTAALNRGRHLYSAERPSPWALAHISSLLCNETSQIFREGINIIFCTTLDTRFNLFVHSSSFLYNNSVKIAFNLQLCCAFVCQFLIDKFAECAVQASFVAMADFDAHDKDRSVLLHASSSSYLTLVIHLLCKKTCKGLAEEFVVKGSKLSQVWFSLTLTWFVFFDTEAQEERLVSKAWGSRSHRLLRWQERARWKKVSPSAIQTMTMTVTLMAVLALESLCIKGTTVSVSSPVVDEERMRPLVGSALCVPSVL